MIEYDLQSKLITEFIGTFFLSLTICTAAVHGTAGDFAPFAIASTLMVMIYAGGHISGAHYNPAVTISVYLRGACDKSDILPYIVTQLIAGAAAAVAASNLLVSDSSVTALEMNSNQAISAEFLYTFALAYVILHVTTSEATEGNQYYGAAIAFVVLAGALSVGAISGASFNPAVSTSLLVAGALEFADVWVHLVPQIGGGCAAAYAFKATAL
ncbi:MAG: aquaporin [Candidatus Thermoplasmatota archaeon]|nr:aquaporin [Candidatus Thermoplasmatota archaeon]MEE2624898.1 aquaporin [Candidatus Thermoplasmatota archaeon]